LPRSGTRDFLRLTRKAIRGGNADMNDDELRRRIAERARQLWEEAGRPEGRDMEYWLEAEEELAPLSVAGEEDPMEALDHDPPRTPRKDGAP
jgi:hypothetical protein